MTSRLPMVFYGYVFFMLGALLFIGISIGTNYWLLIDINGMKINSGLFEVCITDSGRCVSFATSKNARQSGDYKNIETCQGLCITAIFMEGLTLLVMGHLAYKVSANETQLRNNHGAVALFLSCLAGVLALAGVIHFVIKVGSTLSDKISCHFGYSMHFALLSGCLSILAGIFAIIANAKLNKRYQPQSQHNMQGHVIAAPTVQTGTSVTYHIDTPVAQHPYSAGNQPMPIGANYYNYAHQGSVATVSSVVTDKQSPSYQ